MNTTSKYRFLYFVRFIGDALFYPFFSLYLVSIGIEGQTLGLVLGLIPLMTVLANPLWGLITKNPDSHRRIMQGLAISVGVAIIGFTLTNQLPVIIGFTLLLGVSDNPSMSLWDGWVSKHAAEVNRPYASIRIVGSMSYVIFPSVAGLLIAAFGYSATFRIGALFYFLFMFLLKFLPQPGQSPLLTAKEKNSDYARLFKNRSFIIYLVAFLFAVSSAGVADGYLSLMLKQKGMSEDFVGYFWSILVLAEVFLMLFLSRKNMVSQEKKWLVYAVIGHMVRYGLYALNLPLEWTIAASLIRGFSWGIIVYTHIQLLQSMVDSRDLSLAILNINVFSSVYSAIFNPVAGFLYKNISFPALFITFAVLEMIGGLILVFVRPKGDKIVSL